MCIENYIEPIGFVKPGCANFIECPAIGPPIAKISYLSSAAQRSYASSSSTSNARNSSNRWVTTAASCL